MHKTTLWRQARTLTTAAAQRAPGPHYGRGGGLSDPADQARSPRQPDPNGTTKQPAAAPARTEILTLYRQLLRASRRFPMYNFREYFARRTRDAFREHATEHSGRRRGELYKSGLENLAVLERQATVSSLYHGAAVALRAKPGSK